MAVLIFVLLFCFCLLYLLFCLICLYSHLTILLDTLFDLLISE
jgi:hypothetical protein